MKFYPFVEVEWIDAVSSSDWVDEDCLPEPRKVVNRGWLVRVRDNDLTLAASLQSGAEGEGTLGDVTTIPLGMVEAIRELEVAAGCECDLEPEGNGMALMPIEPEVAEQTEAMVGFNPQY